MHLQLERVFGVTLSSNCALCFDSVNSVLAYPAGCTIVLYNVLRREQQFIINSSKKVITCLDMSSDGKFLVSGEVRIELPSLSLGSFQFVSSIVY